MRIGVDPRVPSGFRLTVTGPASCTPVPVSVTVSFAVSPAGLLLPSRHACAETVIVPPTPAVSVFDSILSPGRYPKTRSALIYGVITPVPLAKEQLPVTRTASPLLSWG
jgi:hypothetical protein